MKKSIFYYLILGFYLFESCESLFSNKPKLGDAVFYDYKVMQGDSVIFRASRSIDDTAIIVLEMNQNKEPIQKALIENITKLSLNDSITFNISTQQKGVLRLYRIIPAADFPKHIADANKQEKIFEQDVQNIGRELRASLSFYQNRQKAVLDSTITLNQQYQKGQLNDKLKTLPTGIQYYVIKGNGNIKPARKKWVWFHYASVLPNSNKTVDSYKDLPKSTNLSEFAMIEQLERSAASFDEGSIVLLLIPSKVAHSPEIVGTVIADNNVAYWVEIVKVLQL